MREKLFKAKRIDNGKWVEGFYFCMVHDDGRHIHHFIMPLGADLNLGTPIEKIQVEVDAETVCRYTGLTDKNDNKIWENDIVALYDKHKEKHDYGKVEYGHFNCSCCDGIYGWRFVDGDIRNYDDYEVAGNVFDNPELLEGMN